MRLIWSWEKPPMGLISEEHKFVGLRCMIDLLKADSILLVNYWYKYYLLFFHFLF